MQHAARAVIGGEGGATCGDEGGEAEQRLRAGAFEKLAHGDGFLRVSAGSFAGRLDGRLSSLVDRRDF
jgi:hypothetical protein